MFYLNHLRYYKNHVRTVFRLEGYSAAQRENTCHWNGNIFYRRLRQCRTCTIYSFAFRRMADMFRYGTGPSLSIRFRPVVVLKLGILNYYLVITKSISSLS